MRRWFGAGMAVVIGLSVLSAPPRQVRGRQRARTTFGSSEGVPSATHLKKVAACQALVVTTAGGVADLATSTPTGYDPTDLSSAYGLPSPGRNDVDLERAHGRHRRRVRQPERGERSDRVPTDVRIAAVHERKRLLQEGRAVGQGEAAVGQRRVGSGDRPRHRDGVGGMPECKILLVEAKSRRSPTSARPRTAPRSWAQRPSATATAARSRSSLALRQLLQPPGRGHHRGRGRRRIRELLPGELAARHRRRGNDADPGSPHARTRLRDRLDRRGKRVQRGVRTAGLAAGAHHVRIPAASRAPTGPSRTSLPSPILSTGVSVFDSYGSSGGNDWFVFGGTSVSTPLIAALFALAGDATHNNAYPYPAKWLYSPRGLAVRRHVRFQRQRDERLLSRRPATRTTSATPRRGSTDLPGSVRPTASAAF